MPKETVKPVIVEQPITETLEKNYMPYAMSVIVSRAIPEIDGFKPSHRKLLYTMYKMNLLNGSRIKSANVVGQTMQLNPHGESAIYETLVRLTKSNESLLHPYIDSKGNFGKQYSRDMQYAASRYTEVRLERFSEEVFRGIDRDAVDFVDNYDGTLREPTLLPTSFPSVLVNANQGIAVGMASNICPFNLREVCAATIEYIRDPGFELLDFIPAPDFPSGSEIIYNMADMRRVLATGRGPVRLRSKYRIDRKNGIVEVFEIPYSTTIEAIIDELSELVKSGKIREVNDVRDETDLNGLKIAIDYKKTADPDLLMQKLFRMTSLQTSFNCNFNILINGMPRVLGVKQILGEWLSWRRSCVKRETAFELQRKQDRLHLLLGMEKILLDIDKAIRIVRETEKEADVVPRLMEGFGIDEEQADYVAEIRLRSLNRQYILSRIGDIRALHAEISDLHEVLGDKERLDAVIIDALESVAKRYGADRLTTIVPDEEVEELSDHQMIEDFRLRLFLTAHGYVKKLALTSLRSAGDLKTKEDDRIILEIESHNKADLVFFTNRCNAYKINAYEIRDHKPSDIGEYSPNLLSLEEGERVVHLVSTDDYAGFLLIGFQNGKIARIPLRAYETKTRRKKLVNAFSSASPVVSIRHSLQEEGYAVYSSNGRLLVFESADIPEKTTRSAQGVQILLARKGSVMTELCRLETSGILDVKPYRNRKLPAAGTLIREGTVAERQLGLEGV